MVVSIVSNIVAAQSVRTDCPPDRVGVSTTEFPPPRPIVIPG